MPRVESIASIGGTWVSKIDLHHEGLLMAPPYAIPRLLARHGLRYDDVHLWEIHEAFAAQVLAHIEALENPVFLRDKAGVDPQAFGAFPRDRVNPKVDAAGATEATVTGPWPGRPRRPGWRR